MRFHEGHYADVAEQYARDVVSGKIPACLQIRQQAQRFLNDIDSDEWVYNANLVQRAVMFIQALPHIKSKWASRKQLLVLEPWQVWIIAAIFGVTDHNKKRKHREAVLEVPRKGGKSTVAAGIALYMLVADGEAGAEVLIGANSMDQANHCFIPAREMANRARGFKARWGAETQATSVFLADGSFLKPMIGKPGDGSNPHCAILDEAHENATSEQYDAMKTGMGSREQPLLLTITTAGTNLAGPFHSLLVEAEQVLAGNLKNDRLFAAIYTLDKDDDWRDFNVWPKANPNYGVSCSVEYLRDQYESAMRSVAKQNILRTKHLNQWVSSSDAFVNMVDWANNADAPPLSELANQNLDAWGGLDTATRNDIAAFSILVQQGERKFLYPFLFIAEGAIDKSKNEAAYKTWVESGHLIATDGNAIDFDTIREKIEEIVPQFRFKSIGFDKWQGHNLAQDIQKLGVETLEYGQSFSLMHRPMDDLEAMLAEGTLKHPNNPCLNWMAGNLCAKISGEFKRPDKPAKQPHLKIDGMVAGLMALGLSLAEEPAPTDYSFAFS